MLVFGFLGMTVTAQDTLTLYQAIEAGLENNYSIIIAKNDVQIARNDNTLGNAGFLPAVGINASQNNTITTTHQEQFNGTVKDVSNGHNTNYNAGIQLTWTLFDGFSMFISKNMLEVLEKMGETEARVVIENTVSEIILNYYGIIQQEKMIQVLRDAVDLSLQRKKIAEAKLSLGSGSQLMLLQSTVDLNTDSTNLIKELAAVRHTKADLNRLLARNPEILFEVIDTINMASRLSYDTLLARARSQNADLMIARSTMDLDFLALREARSQRYPRLNFQAGYNYNQLSSQTGFSQYNLSYGSSYGLTFSYPIYSGFNVNLTIRNAELQLNSSDIQVRSTESDVHNNLFKIFIDYLTNLQVVTLQTANQAVARENVIVAFEKYRLGTISDIDLRDTQKKFIDAQYQLLLSQFEAKKAEIELLRLSGDLFRSVGN